MAVRALLEADGRFDVVGSASNGQIGFAEALRLRPDAVTMDIDMPVVDGVEATAMIAAGTDAAIVLLTGSESSERVREGLDAGASTHVPKRRAAEDLADALLAAVA